MTLDLVQGVVADTNVIISVLLNAHSEPEQAQWYRPHLEMRDVAISFQTHAELLVQREDQNWNSERLQRIMTDLTIVPMSPELVEAYVFIRAASIRRRERSRARILPPLISPADGWHAAAAWVLHRPLVTDDRKLAACDEVDIISRHADEVAVMSP